MSQFEGLRPDQLPLLLTETALSLLTAAMLIFTVRFLKMIGRLNQASISLAYQNHYSQLKCLALLSLAAGILGTLIETKNILVVLGQSGGDVLDKGIGALGEALIPMVYGVTGFLFGLLCMVIILAQGSRPIANQHP